MLLQSSREAELHAVEPSADGDAGGFWECSVALTSSGSKNPCDGRKASADSIVMYDKLQ